ncbi:hypothetical protein C0995_004561 [Termitomyces sp. Mi166|nr:hypothetical protein C0995_004561 [Termitomyces sp. Mi166\
MPTVAPQPIMNPAPMPVSTTSSIQHAPLVPYIADPSSLLMRFWRFVVTAGTFFLMASAPK